MPGIRVFAQKIANWSLAVAVTPEMASDETYRKRTDVTVMASSVLRQGLAHSRDDE